VVDTAGGAESNFGKYLSNLLRARFPLIFLTTWEEGRALAVIRSIAKDTTMIRTPRAVFTWKSTTGMSSDDVNVTEDLSQPLKALEFIERYPEAAVFVLHDFHVYFGADGGSPDNQVIRKMRDIFPDLKHCAQPKNVILISPVAYIPKELEKDVAIVDLELPGLTEVHDLLENMIRINAESGRISTDLTDEQKEWLCKAALGLTLDEVESAFARAMVDDGRLDARDFDIIIQEKRQIIRKSGILEFIEHDISIGDVGGLENLKRWLARRDKSWMDTAQEYGLPSPKGILLTGVPGCGKSLVCKSVSDMWHLPLLRLDVGRIFSSLEGSSESNMREATKVAEAVAPSVLWIDEIEKGFSGLGSVADSGTSSRVFGTFLTWLQEKTKPVFVVATSNDIESLPPELLRKGRFDEVFFVDLPTRRERAEILRLHITKRLKSPKAAGDLKVDDSLVWELAGLSEGFSGAEIEQSVVNALYDAFFEDRAVTADDFRGAISSTISLSVTRAEKISSLREWAKTRAVPATAPEGAAPSDGPVKA